LLSAVKESLSLLSTVINNYFISFDFNKIQVTLKSDSDPNLIERDFFRALKGYIPNNIGPYPMANLNPEVVAKEQLLDEKKELERKNKEIQRKLLLDAKKAVLLEEISEYPMSRDETMWKIIFDTNSGDDYSFACVEFAELWARCMEKALAEGKTIPEVKEDLEKKVNDCIGGITGFMHSCVIQILSQCWKYGDELRKIHNLETQIGTEGEAANESGRVLNSALLNVSVLSQYLPNKLSALLPAIISKVVFFMPTRDSLKPLNHIIPQSSYKWI
jgi:hypothetical protein